MNRKLTAALLALTLALGLCACGGGAAEPSKGGGDAETFKVGLIFAGDESDGYTYNFARGENDAAVMLAAEGIVTEWIVRRHVEESDACEEANRELAEEGCKIIFNTSSGFEKFMLKAAPDYPDVHFVACTNCASRNDGLSNTHNAFANIHEGRYLAGVVAGLKLQELIDNGAIAPEEALIGYVAAFDCPEVISGYSAYFLGARSVCPTATMKTLFVGAWADEATERGAATALAIMGCKMISQHSDTAAPAAIAQSAGIFHTGYNSDMTLIAPEASLVSTRIDWFVYFEHAVRAVINGEELEQDWSHGLDEYAVELTPLNRELIPDGADETLDKVKAALADGSLQVFDTSAFTVNGETVTHAFALDTDGDGMPDAGEAVFDGAFHESYFQSAPYFALAIDGIEKLN